MFDFDLQLRFWRGMSDAYWHGAEAAMAAAAVWQDEILPPKPAPKPPAAPLFPVFDFSAWAWMWPMAANLAQPQPAYQRSQQPVYMHPFLLHQPAMPAAHPFAAMMPWAEIFVRESMALWPGQKTAWGAPNAHGAAMFGPFWNWAASPWAFMQMPLTAMMMSAGLPYAVASPSAKASTAAMDAAEAARQHMEKVFSAYRSDGGHAAAQIVSLPWSIAASFLATEAPRGRAA